MSTRVLKKLLAGVLLLLLAAFVGAVLWVLYVTTPQLRSAICVLLGVGAAFPLLSWALEVWRG